MLKATRKTCVFYGKNDTHLKKAPEKTIKNEHLVFKSRFIDEKLINAQQDSIKHPHASKNGFLTFSFQPSVQHLNNGCRSQHGTTFKPLPRGWMKHVIPRDIPLLFNRLPSAARRILSVFFAFCVWARSFLAQRPQVIDNQLNRPVAAILIDIEFERQLDMTHAAVRP